MQKRSTPTKSQQAAISAAGLNPMVWTVLKEWDKYLLVHNWVSGGVKTIKK